MVHGMDWNNQIKCKNYANIRGEITLICVHVEGQFEKAVYDGKKS